MCHTPPGVACAARVATTAPWRAGDVWDVQPAPEDHPWRTMRNHGMTAHVAGNTLDAQARYQQARRMLLRPEGFESLFAGLRMWPATRWTRRRATSRRAACS